MRVTTLLVAAFLLLAGVARSQSAQSDGAARLDAFAATWAGSGESYKTAESGASTAKSTIVCTWTEGHVFLVCPGTVWVNGSSTPFHQLAIYTYDANAKKYRFTAVTPGGTYTPALSVNGNTWSYDSNYTNAAGKKVYNRTLNIFNPDGSYRYVTQYSYDNVNWIDTGKGSSTKA